MSPEKRRLKLHWVQMVILAFVVVVLGLIMLVLFEHKTGTPYPLANHMFWITLFTAAFIGLVIAALLLAPVYVPLVKYGMYERWPSATLAIVSAVAMALFALSNGAVSVQDGFEAGKDVWVRPGESAPRNVEGVGAAMTPLGTMAWRSAFALLGLVLSAMSMVVLRRNGKDLPVFLAPALVFFGCLIVSALQVREDMVMISHVRALRNEDPAKRAAAADLLRKSGDFRSLQNLKWMVFQDKSPAVRAGAAAALAERLLRENISFPGAIDDPDPVVRLAVLGALERLRTRLGLSDSDARSWCTSLYPHLGDPDPKVRKGTADLMIRIGPLGGDYAGKMLGKGPEARAQALRVIGSVGGTEDILELLYDLGDSMNRDVVQKVAERAGIRPVLDAAFGRGGPGEYNVTGGLIRILVGMRGPVPEQLVETARDREADREVRAFSVRALYWRGDKAVADPLVRELVADRKTAMILEDVGSQAVEVLLQLWDEGDQDTRALIEKAMRGMNGHVFGGNAAAWRKKWAAAMAKRESHEEIAKMIREGDTGPLILMGEPAMDRLIQELASKDRRRVRSANSILFSITRHRPLQKLTERDAYKGWSRWTEWWTDVKKRRLGPRPH